ncbi:MAG: family 20 glycosylhydrolase, partial [Oscillospiraceae bacterium]|nr:family 20 glycosylhydrolase [Oscillospiraceae bacterium]
MKSTVAWVLLVVMVIGLLPAVPVFAVADTSAVGEVVDRYVKNDKTFTLSDISRIFVIADTEPSGELLQTVQLIGRQFHADKLPTDAAMDIVWGPESWIDDGDIVVRMDATSGVAPEGYELEVGTTARVTASDVRGLIYGANMLQKHLRYAGSNSIRGFSASDTPDTVQRAVSLDCGRKYYTKDWICNFIREMSWMGYNTLQFHFSDDSGFRFDLWDPAYYQGQFQPKNDFSWICGSNYTSWTLAAYQNDKDKGKYLTTAEVVEILRTAAEYHIEVIPCFDSPSHLDYLTWTFEQNYDSNNSYSFYSTYDQKTYYAKDVNGIINYTGSKDWSTALKWPYYSAVNVKGALAKAFIFELYIDIANFFKEYAGADHMSVGADEVQLNTSNISSSYKYAWGFPDFVNYINELNALLGSMGYTMRMYNDFLGSTAYNATNYKFADNIQIQYWDSPFNPSSKTANNHTQPVSYYVDEGRVIYNCIQTGTYYALRKTSGGSDARSVRNRQWTFYHSNEEDIWDEWYPADISEHGDYVEDVPDVPEANLGGAYFLIWGDYACVSTEKEIWNGCYDTDGSGEYYSLRDRMWSNITKMWNWDVNDTLSFTNFVKVRDAYGDHPGIGTTVNSCSEPTLLPAATEIKSGYAGGCESYHAYGQILVKAASPVMTLPCDSTTEATSVQLELAGNGDRYTVVGIYNNTVGQLWYKVIGKTGSVGHILAADTVYLEDLTDDISLTAATYPSGLVKGGYFFIRGQLSAQRNQLTTVTAEVLSGFGLDGAVATGASAEVTDNAYTLGGSTVDDGVLFGNLALGQYTYVVRAGYTTNHVEDGQVVQTTGEAVLLEKCFMVISAAADQASCAHSYEQTVVLEATCVAEGWKVFSCATCGHVYEESVPYGGHAYTSETVGATCMDYEKVRHTCTLCGDSYEEYPEHLLTQWSETKPEGVPEALIQTKQQYRYSDHETTISTDSALEGYTQTGSQWVKTSTGKVQYVNSWPAGFSTANSLYSQYNNKASKVTAYETETTKRVIDSDAVGGYLYYHWCYAGSYYSVANSTGKYKVFHAYYSTTAPSNYQCDTSDMSYKTSWSGCSNSNWHFVTNVYTQSYTDYEKQYTYERWTDWSDWSDEIFQTSDTRKVESRTLYRYVDGAYAAHTYGADSVCTLCGDVCGHSYQNNICTDCGVAKPQYDYYLFGWINGGNYACEENYEDLGGYKFVDGQVVVFFTEDSYVGVKASNNVDWYMTDGWQGFVSSVTLYNTTKLDGPTDKLFVPGGTEVTFTLVDNGDDTYELSYVAVECGHASHTTEGVCTVCGDAVEHSFGTNGFCVCGLECDHQMADGLCTVCGKECVHTYQNNVCTVCGQAKPQYDYYLFGWINGANYACEEDYANLGEYKFVDGKLEVRFQMDSYVAVKASDNAHWYMTEGWQGNATSTTLYNTTVLSNADKLFVPGGKLVTFTLVDNGDDTYVLSYEAACPHDSHDQNGVCSGCGETVPHSLKDNVCSVCGWQKPQYDYYLFGWINGTDYADKDDKENLGAYKFADGKLTVYFTEDSYVGVKSSDNLNWYMTDGYLGEVTSATLYDSRNIATEDKLFVPAGKIITFTLVDNGDDTYVLSYVAEDCSHADHSTDGICAVCGGTADHAYVQGQCACGKECDHSFQDGICSVCGIVCVHDWRNGLCQICGVVCGHSWVDGVCSVCSVHCKHSWVEGECVTCGMVCGHNWNDGVCDVCGIRCQHTYQNNICTNCGFRKPATEYHLSGVINGQDYAWGTDAESLGQYLFVDGTLTVTFRQDSFVALKAANNAGWYLTEGDQGQATSVVLYNMARVEDGQLLWVPGCMEITFTLVDNGDDTLTLSYTAKPCAHEVHDQDGLCVACGTAVEHGYEAVVTEPTCTEGGCTTYTCAVCGDSYVADETDALGHDYEAVVTEPTCTEGGCTTYTCSVCGDS